MPNTEPQSPDPTNPPSDECARTQRMPAPRFDPDLDYVHDDSDVTLPPSQTQMLAAIDLIEFAAASAKPRTPGESTHFVPPPDEPTSAKTRIEIAPDALLQTVREDPPDFGAAAPVSPVAPVVPVAPVAPIAQVETLAPPTDSPFGPAKTRTESAPSALLQTIREAPPDFGAAAPVSPVAPAVPVAPVAPIARVETLAPPPDSPFGTPSSGVHVIDNSGMLPGTSRVKAPAPSGANWRSVLAEVPVATPKPVLVASGLIKWFGKRQVVRGVDVEVGAGEIVGLLGRNGAGKTTTFRMIIGLLHPDGGNVKYENRDVTRLPMYARANRGIGYLAQQPSIFQKLTVEENLMAVLELQEPNRKLRKSRMEELIEQLGLATVRLSQAAVLSGGERRRLEIARAMSLRPRVVLFDEPFAGIDPITVTEIQGILKDLKARGVGVLLTDHNVRETLTITDRTYIMDEGKIWIHGHPRDIVANEEARSRYLGHEFRLDF